MNDKIDSIPAITPARDEIEQRSRTTRAEAPRQSNFNGMLVFVIVLMAIVMGVGGYTIYEVQLKLDEANVLLAKGQENIKALEDRLAATGTDVSKTLQDMQGEIRKNFTQIDLLWGHAYRTNKPNIEKNTATISRLQKDIDSKVKPLVNSMAGVEGKFNSLSEQMTQVRQGLQDDANEMTTQVSMVRGQVQDQAVIAEANRRNIAALTGQLKDAQEAIDVIDRYRQQVNQRIVDLQKQMMQQQAP
jgi:chromosome segregation ATPase